MSAKDTPVELTAPTLCNLSAFAYARLCACWCVLMRDPQCAECRFGAHATDADKSYAAALLGGAGNAKSLLDGAKQVARQEIVPGVTAFCDRCSCVRWIAMRDSLSDSLVDFTRRLREARELEEAVA